jgi:hypothetical protein
MADLRNNGPDAWLDCTLFHKELMAWFAAERATLRDPENGDGATVSMKTNPERWLLNCNMFPNIRNLGFATLFVPATQLECERLWKQFEAVATKKRAKIQVETAADQMFVKMMWKMSTEYSGLSKAGPPTFQAIKGTKGAGK